MAIKTKLQITMSDELLERLDEYAGVTYTPRSSVIAQAVSQFLNQQEIVFALRDIAASIRKVADTGVMDDETKQMLEDFERLCKMTSIT